MENFEITLSHKTKVFSDSKSAISIVKNLVQHDRMKYVRIDRSFIKREIEEGGIDLSYVPITDQVDDVFTKAVTRPVFEALIGNLGVMSIYSPV